MAHENGGGAKIQVAEQYYLYPSFAAAWRWSDAAIWGCDYDELICRPRLPWSQRDPAYAGDGTSEYGDLRKEYPYTLMETDSRDGAITDGRRAEKTRRRLTFEFEGGKTAFMISAGAQYHSYIRSRHLNVQGRRENWMTGLCGG